MNRLAVVLYYGFPLAALQAPVEQLATSANGDLVLFRSRLRLQSDADPAAGNSPLGGTKSLDTSPARSTQETQRRRVHLLSGSADGSGAK